LYNTSWWVLIASFPLSFFLTKKMAQDPLAAGKFMRINSAMSMTCVLVFAYGMITFGRAEREVT
jgi:ethanolamine transporter EutH